MGCLRTSNGESEDEMNQEGQCWHESMVEHLFEKEYLEWH
jgi:hypothetical protein